MLGERETAVGDGNELQQGPEKVGAICKLV